MQSVRSNYLVIIFILSNLPTLPRTFLFPKLPLPCSTDQTDRDGGIALQDARVLRYHFRTQGEGCLLPLAMD